ncbi:MAG TPA: IS110 family transposase [Candidatus Limnocylindria bacterium]|nr:IS110 family transposase [Candidatus Limnocylindria bacterium]
MNPMVGFDVAKNTVVGTVLDTGCQLLVPPATIRNTDESLQAWLAGLKAQYGELTVCCESTGYYHYPVVRASVALGLSCRVLNPIVTKQATKATIRGKKTDASDAVLIARLGLRGEGVITTDVDNQAKVLLRVSDKLQVMSQSLVLLERSMAERRIVPPAGSEIHYQACLEALKVVIVRYRTAVIAKVPRDTLDLLTSIPGVGDKTAAVLVAEVGDIARFASAEKLVAYAGLDPRVRQSGISLHRNTRLTKRGSPSLRRAIYTAANVTRQHDAGVKAYYQRKRKEGRTHTEAMIPTCRRLLNRIYAVWTERRLYEKRTERTGSHPEERG